MKKVLHKVKAWLYNDAQTIYDSDNMTARAISEETLTIAGICDSAVSRGTTSATAVEMEHHVIGFLKEMTYLLANGYSINTGYFTAYACIQGVFKNNKDKFDPERHKLLFQFIQGALLREEIENTEVEILGVASNELYVSEVTDIKTREVNSALTPCRNLRISGYKLKIVGNSNDVGIYFINQASLEKVKVEASDIIINIPSELVIVIPKLPAGEYKLQITTQYNGCNVLKEPHTTIFDKILTPV